MQTSKFNAFDNIREAIIERFTDNIVSESYAITELEKGDFLEERQEQQLNLH